MKKMIKLLFVFISGFSLTLLCSCKDKKTTKSTRIITTNDSSKYSEKEIMHRSLTGNDTLHLKCVCRTDVTSYMDGAFFVIKEDYDYLKDKTDGTFYHEDEKYMIFLKNGEFFVIEKGGKLEDGGLLCRLYAESSTFISYSAYHEEAGFGVPDITVNIPFPQLALTESNHADARRKAYIYERTVIDNKYRDYIIQYYKDLSRFSGLEKTDNEVKFYAYCTTFNDGKVKCNFTVHLDDVITITVEKVKINS